METFAQPSFRRKPESRGFDLAHPEPVEGPEGLKGWFDKLTMSGDKGYPLTLSVSKGVRVNQTICTLTKEITSWAM